MPRRTTRSQAALDSGPATTRSGTRFQALEDSEPPNPPPKSKRGTTETTPQNEPKIPKPRPKPRPKPHPRGRNGHGAPAQTDVLNSSATPSGEGDTPQRPSGLSTSKVQALRIIREYALNQKEEVKDITDKVQQVLKNEFSVAWSGVIDAAGREDPDEDPNLTLVRAFEKAAKSLSLPAEELHRISSSSNTEPDLSPVHSRSLSRQPTSPLPEVDEFPSAAGVHHEDVDVEDDNNDHDPPLRSSKHHYGNPKRSRSRKVPEKQSPVSECEGEPDEEELGGTARNVKSSSKTQTKATSRGADPQIFDEPDKTPNPNVSLDHSDEDDDGALSDPDEVPGKPGPVDAKIRAEAQRNYEEYEAKQRALALKAGKPLSAIFRAAGDSRKLLRGWNLWNVWQKWLVHEDGGKKEGESPNEGEDQGIWMKRRWEEKRREVLGGEWQDRRKVQDAFQWLVDWYEPLYQANAVPIIQRGLSKRQIQNVAEDFNNNARHANRNVGVCCFGFIVDLHGEHSVMFGAGKEFEDMRARSHTQLDQYLTDVVALLRTSNVNLRLGSNFASDHRLIVQHAASVPLKSKKDAHRKFISAVLRYDLAMIDSSFTPWQTRHFNWQEFADLAYTYRVRLINWHSLVGVPGTTLHDLKTKLPVNILYEIGEARLLELKRHAESYDKGKDEEDIVMDIDSGALRLVEWEEWEKELAVEKQGDIAVVLGTNKKTLCRVKNSEKWVKAVNGDTRAKQKRGKARRSRSRSSSRSRSRSHSRSRSRSPGPSRLREASPKHTATRSRSRSPAPKPSQKALTNKTKTRPSSHSRSGIRAPSARRSPSPGPSRSNTSERGRQPTRPNQTLSRNVSKSLAEEEEQVVWDETLGDNVPVSRLPNADSPIPTPKYGITKSKQKRARSSNSPGAHKKRRLGTDERTAVHDKEKRREEQVESGKSSQRSGKSNANERDRINDSRRGTTGKGKGKAKA
ncbi:hypothetical protein K435DRAFT_858919 [Dendrothele bispora CBS 962.96]|uniref:Uncharacterized protein n=1 Tax=Dendrothele bispora (strain CBS 962.96) TaxID=1314807 RepID=A0A4S8M322_DENBC|nr:hypothetical protein K435DRAFT_858919 [Dendrothele bispora CBS 962.96]